MRNYIKEYAAKGDKEITKNQLVIGMLLVLILALAFQRVLDNTFFLLGRQPEFGQTHLIRTSALVAFTLYLLYKLRQTFSWNKEVEDSFSWTK